MGEPAGKTKSYPQALFRTTIRPGNKISLSSGKVRCPHSHLFQYQIRDNDSGNPGCPWFGISFTSYLNVNTTKNA